MDNLISKLSEIRSNFDCFNKSEEPYYRALSEAIKKLSERKDGGTISREVAIIQLSHNKCGNDEYDIAVQHDIETIKALAPAQPKSEERIEKSAQNVPNDDLISRKAAIDAVCAVCGNDCDKSEFVYNAPQDEQVILCPEHYVLCTLPPAQPELPDWVQKVEEYRKSAPSIIHNPLAWALYQTWKEYNGQLVHQRGKENR